MGLDKKEDEFYRQGDDEFWKRDDDSFWNSDERYIRKDEYSQGQNVGSTDSFWNQSNDSSQRQTTNWTDEWMQSGQNAYASSNYGNQGTYNYQYATQNPDTKVDEYKKNSRILLRFVLACAAIMVVGIIFTVLTVVVTRNTMERKIKELDYETYTHSSEELMTINDSNVIVSDAFMVYDTSEVWMPSGKMLIAVYVEAFPVDEDTYNYDAGINQPYLEYDGHYVEPMTDQKMKDMLLKEGMEEDSFLSVYSIGNYQEDAGFYFFLVDEDAEEFAFVIDKREKENGRVEYLKERHFIEIELY